MGVAVGEHQPLRRAYGGGTQKRKGVRLGMSQLRRKNSQLTGMSFASTAKHFLERLSRPDTEKLRSTLQSLDGKCIRIGSTCSGTDVIVPVFLQTFKVLCEIFHAPGPL